MSLFFIQQYIVAQTSQFLAEIQTTVALHHNPNPNPNSQHLLLNSQIVTRDKLTY